MIKEILAGFLYQGDKKGAEKVARADQYPRVRRRLLFGGVICAARELKLDYGALPRVHVDVMEGYPTDPACFDAAVCFFEVVGKPVFVHCNAGINRSAACCAAILHASFKAPIERALDRTNPELPGPLKASLKDWASGWNTRKGDVRKKMKRQIRDLLKNK